MEAGEDGETRGAYLEWAATLAERAAETRGSMSRAHWLAMCAPEVENVREALRLSLDDHGERAVEAAGRIAAGMASFWFAAGGQGEGRRWIESALERLGRDGTTLLHARLHLGLAYLTGAREAADAARSAIALFERFGSAEGIARASGTLAWNLSQTGQYGQAKVAAVRALGLWKELGKSESFEFACDLDTHATIQDYLGDKEGARKNYMAALALYDAIGDDEGTADTRLNLAELEAGAGNLPEAMRLVDEAIGTLHRLRSSGREALGRINAAGYLLALGDADGARETARTALLEAQRLQMSSVTFAVEHLASVAALKGESERAARLLGYVDAWYRNAGYAPGPTELKSREILVEAIKRQLSSDQIEAEQRVGAALTEEKAIQEALKV